MSSLLKVATLVFVLILIAVMAIFIYLPNENIRQSELTIDGRGFQARDSEVEYYYLTAQELKNNTANKRQILRCSKTTYDRMKDSLNPPKKHNFYVHKTRIGDITWIAIAE